MPKVICLGYRAQSNLLGYFIKNALYQNVEMIIKDSKFHLGKYLDETAIKLNATFETQTGFTEGPATYKMHKHEDSSIDLLVCASRISEANGRRASDVYDGESFAHQILIDVPKIIIHLKDSKHSGNFPNTPKLKKDLGNKIYHILHPAREPPSTADDEESEYLTYSVRENSSFTGLYELTQAIFETDFKIEFERYKKIIDSTKF